MVVDDKSINDSIRGSLFLMQSAHKSLLHAKRRAPGCVNSTSRLHLVASSEFTFYASPFFTKSTELFNLDLRQSKSPTRSFTKRKRRETVKPVLSALMIR